MRAPHHGRNTRAYINAAKAYCAPRPGAICYLCSERIHYGLRPRHTLSPTVDHLIPLSLGGALMDLNNWRLAHYGCNADRGNGPPTAYAYATDRALNDGAHPPLITVTNTSRTW
jgi:5-methylcytosine-specific restriction endonuclease McrA